MLPRSPHYPAASDDTLRVHGFAFVEWRDCFLEDARLHGLERNAELLNDTALRLFWQEGVAPTVSALLTSADGSSAA